jgi:predicted TIM-barrel fold metal-dependent hydrolase
MLRTLALLSFLALSFAAAETPPEQWRRDKRTIDTHVHLDGSRTGLLRAFGILDRAGIGVAVNLSGGTVTHKPGEMSALEKNKAMADQMFPGRFLQAMNLDYAGWDEPDFSERAARQIEEGFRMGASSFKEYKRLGLYLRDGKKQLIKIDDPKLDAMWEKCGELGLPVHIHVADPRAFWLPYDEKNERWAELKDHKSWWFGDPAKYPPREELLAALDRVVAKHPKTTFICVHFANNSEDLDWVDQKLDERPNMYADLAARIPELGRHDPEKARRILTKHADRILFATDFMVYDKLILGSSGDADKPTDDDANVFYQKCWRYLETDDRNWAHMTPIQGDWTINAIKLPPEVLRKIYFDNARRLLARAMPLPVMTAAKTGRDFVPDGVLDEPEWQQAKPVQLEYQSGNAKAVPALSTTVRALWSKDFLYLAYECPYTELNVFTPAQKEKRMGLWDKDVVEIFIASNPDKVNRYSEFEWAPNGEQLDLTVEPGAKDFSWKSGAESAVKIDEAAHVWRVEVRIPMKALVTTDLVPPGRWRINLFRHDTASNSGLAFSPALKPSFHTPERFGWLEFKP